MSSLQLAVTSIVYRIARYDDEIRLTSVSVCVCVLAFLLLFFFEVSVLLVIWLSFPGKPLVKVVRLLDLRSNTSGSSKSCCGWNNSVLIT